MAEANLVEVKMPSGAILRVGLAKFAVSRSLYQAILEELKMVKIEGSDEIDITMMKDLFCTGMASKKVEAALWECMKHSLYNNARITEDTFEPEDARQDYMSVCFEVGKANVMPFMKSLTQQFSQAMEMIRKNPA